MQQDYPIKIIVNLILTFIGALMAVWGFYEITVSETLIGNKYSLEGRESSTGWLFLLIGISICGYGLFNWRISRH